MSRLLPLVSIGLPVFNGENYLEDAILSVLNQDYKNIELLLSDNCSTDKTPDICEYYASIDSRVEYIRHKRNHGVSYNYNFCFMNTSGEYFKWMAHDDIIDPSYLSTCVNSLSSYSKDVGACTLTRLVDKDLNFVRLDPFRLSKSHNAYQRLSNFYNSFYYINPFYGLFRREALRQTRLVAPFPSSGIVLLAELLMMGRINEVEKPLFARRLHPDSSHNVATTRADRLSWYDTSSSRVPFLSEKPYVLKELLKSVLRANISAKDKMVCFWITVFKYGIPVIEDRLHHHRSILRSRLGNIVNRFISYS